MEKELNIAFIKEKTVSECIKENSIVWLIDSNLDVVCGIVKEVNKIENTAWVFVYDQWSDWSVTFDKIVRVGTSYYSDTYRNSTKGNIR